MPAFEYAFYEVDYTWYPRIVFLFANPDDWLERAYPDENDREWFLANLWMTLVPLRLSSPMRPPAFVIFDNFFFLCSLDEQCFVYYNSVLTSGAACVLFVLLFMSSCSDAAPAHLFRTRIRYILQYSYAVHLIGGGLSHS